MKNLVSRLHSAKTRQVYVGLALACFFLPVVLRAAEGQVQSDANTNAQLAAIKGGDATQSALSLAQLIPDGPSLIRHHAAIIQLAEQVDGEMDLAVLKNACPQYHAWHAAIVITNSTRSLAILQWMAEKLWEMPRGKEKNNLAEIVIGDVDLWIERGRIAVRPGLELACNSILQLESIGPGAPTASLVRLFEKHANGGDPELHEYIYNTLWEIGRLPGQTDFESLAQFLREHYPNKARKLNTRDLFFPIGLTTPQPLSWEEYELLPKLSLEQISAETKRCHCESAQGGSYCVALIKSLLDKWDEKPQEANTVLVSLLAADAVAPELILNSMWYRMADPDYLFRKAGIHDALFDSFKQGLSKTPTDVQSVTRVIHNADTYLRGLATISAQKRTPYTVELEKRALSVLFSAGPVWERVRMGDATRYYGPSPYAVMKEKRSSLSPEAMRFLEKSAKDFLDHASALGGLSQEARDDAKSALTSFISAH